MSRLPFPTLALAAVLTACGGADAPTADLGPLADQADRVAQLIDEGRGCAAVDALADLRSLAEQDVPAEVRDTVVGFTRSAEQSVTCEPPATEPQGDEGNDEGRDDGGRPEDAGDEDEGKKDEGKDEDGEDKPGRGHGRDDEDSDD